MEGHRELTRIEEAVQGHGKHHLGRLATAVVTADEPLEVLRDAFVSEPGVKTQHLDKGARCQHDRAGVPLACQERTMPKFVPWAWLRRRLLAYIATETGCRALQEEVSSQTLERLRGLPTECAADSDVLAWALNIARELLVDLRRPGRNASTAPGATMPLGDGFATPATSGQAEDNPIETVDDLLAPRLVEFFHEYTDDWTLTKALVRRTIAAVCATPLSYATASDIVTYGFHRADEIWSASRREPVSRTIDPEAQGTERSDEEGSEVDWIGRYEQSTRARAAEALERAWMMQQPAGSALGPHHPVWRKLYEALKKFATHCDGEFASVMDVGGVPWCIAPAQLPAGLDPLEGLRAAKRFYEIELVPRMAILRRGQRVHIAKDEGADRYVAVSFAGIYVVVVWFDEEVETAYMRPKILRMLPEIQSLTLALPPWPGPGCDEGATRVRA